MKLTYASKKSISFFSIGSSSCLKSAVELRDLGPVAKILRIAPECRTVLRNPSLAFGRVTFLPNQCLLSAELGF
jgi:hypothetical protein